MKRQNKQQDPPSLFSNCPAPLHSTPRHLLMNPRFHTVFSFHAPEPPLAFTLRIRIPPSLSPSTLLLHVRRSPHSRCSPARRCLPLSLNGCLLPTRPSPTSPCKPSSSWTSRSRPWDTARVVGALFKRTPTSFRSNWSVGRFGLAWLCSLFSANYLYSIQNLKTKQTNPSPMPSVGRSEHFFQIRREQFAFLFPTRISDL